MDDAKRRRRELERREKQEEALREREKKSPYRNFAQLNRENIPHLDRACRDNPTATATWPAGSCMRRRLQTAERAGFNPRRIPYN